MRLKLDIITKLIFYALKYNTTKVRKLLFFER